MFRLKYMFFFLTVIALSFGSHISTAQERIRDLLNGMTLEQKVAQMFMVSLYSDSLIESERQFLQQYQPGAIVLLGRNVSTPSQVTRLTNTYQQTSVDSGGLPLFIAIDQEGGIIAHLQDGFTQWPVPMLLTASGDVTLARRFGMALGEELKAVGINMNLAPVADLNTNIANPIIGRRAFGDSPELVAPIIAAVIEGMQSVNVAATAKHFPGHGDTSEDSHTELPVLLHPLERLQRIEFVPFQSAMNAGVAAIMVGHLLLPSIDNQYPASLSPALVQGLLRQELGYNGLIMTDALDMDAIDNAFTPPEAAVQAVLAGHDMILIGANVGLEAQGRSIEAVVAAVRDGLIDETRIDDSVYRILLAKERFGVLDWQPLDPSTAGERVHLEAHQALVEEMFAAGITLARDQSGLIPLQSPESALIIYPATRTVIQRACAAYSDEVHWLAISQSPTAEEIAWATQSAQQAETVIAFTINAYTDTAQQRLIEALPPDRTAVVALWSPYDWLAIAPISTYMVTYSPLDPAAYAACAVIFGQQPAYGQLPLTLGENLPAGRGITSKGL